MTGDWSLVLVEGEGGEEFMVGGDGKWSIKVVVWEVESYLCRNPMLFRNSNAV